MAIKGKSLIPALAPLVVLFTKQDGAQFNILANNQDLNPGQVDELVEAKIENIKKRIISLTEGSKKSITFLTTSSE